MEALFNFRIPAFWGNTEEEAERSVDEEDEDEFVLANDESGSAKDVTEGSLGAIFNDMTNEKRKEMNELSLENTAMEEAAKEIDAMEKMTESNYESIDPEMEKEEDESIFVFDEVDEAMIQKIEKEEAKKSKGPGDKTMIAGLWRNMDNQANAAAFGETTLCKILTNVNISPVTTKTPKCVTIDSETDDDDDVEEVDQKLHQETAGPGDDTIITGLWNKMNGQANQTTFAETTLCKVMEAATSSNGENEVNQSSTDSQVGVEPQEKNETLVKNTDEIMVIKATEEVEELSWRQPAVGDTTMLNSMWRKMNTAGDATLMDRIQKVWDQDGLQEQNQEELEEKQHGSILEEPQKEVEEEIESSKQIEDVKLRSPNATVDEVWEQMNQEGDTTILERIQANLVDGLTTEYKAADCPRWSLGPPSPLPVSQVPTNSTVRSSVAPHFLLPDISTIPNHLHTKEPDSDLTPDMFSPNFTKKLERKNHYQVCWTTQDSSELSHDTLTPNPKTHSKVDVSFVKHGENGNISSFLHLAEQKKSQLFDAETDPFKRDFNANGTSYEFEESPDEMDKATRMKWHFRNRSSRVGTGLGTTPGRGRPNLGLGVITSPTQVAPVSLLQDSIVEETPHTSSFSPDSNASSASSAMSSVTLSFIEDDSCEMIKDLTVRDGGRQPMYDDPSLPSGWWREVSLYISF